LCPAKSTNDIGGFHLNGDEVGVLVFIVLTVALFALLGLAVKLVERL
jgi:hypothetical protein